MIGSSPLRTRLQRETTCLPLCLLAMARLAQTLQVGLVIGSTLGLGCDVIRLSGCRTATGLAQWVTLQDHASESSPACAVATAVGRSFRGCPRLPLPVLVRLAVLALRGGVAATDDTAGARGSVGHAGILRS